MHILNCSSNSLERELASLAGHLHVLHSAILQGNTPLSNAPEKEKFPDILILFQCMQRDVATRGRFNGSNTRNAMVVTQETVHKMFPY